MQLLAKFKKMLYMGFRATLNFRKFKAALNPMYRILAEISLFITFEQNLVECMMSSLG